MSLASCASDESDVAVGAAGELVETERQHATGRGLWCPHAVETGFEYTTGFGCGEDLSLWCPHAVETGFEYTTGFGCGEDLSHGSP